MTRHYDNVASSSILYQHTFQKRSIMVNKDNKDKKEASRSTKSVNLDDVRKTLKEINKNIKFGDGDDPLQLLGDEETLKINRFPTGMPNVDAILGGDDDTGYGFPTNRLVEIFGPEASGKTYIALKLIGNVQKMGGVAALIDAEQCFDPTWATRNGVNVDDLVYSQENAPMEGVLDMVKMMIESNKFDVIVIDSVPSLVPQVELDNPLGKQNVAVVARILSQALRQIVGVLGRSKKTSLIFINQLRDNPGIMFGNPETTPGGRALKYWASVRLEVRKMAQSKGGNIMNDYDSEEQVGHRARVKTIKNKTAPPLKSAIFDLIYIEQSLIDVLVNDAIERGIIKVIGKRKKKYYFNDELVASGEGKESIADLKLSIINQGLVDDIALAVGYDEKQISDLKINELTATKDADKDNNDDSDDIDVSDLGID